jgi:hypothetical protein
MILRVGVVRWQAGRLPYGEILAAWGLGVRVFSEFLGPRMTEDAREWETERGFRAETQGRGGRKETGERMSESGT